MTVDELIKQFQKQYSRAVYDDLVTSAANVKINKGSGSYADLLSLASKSGKKSGDILAGLLRGQYGDGDIPETEAKAILRTCLKDNYDFISERGELVQNAINKKMGVGLKALRPEYNVDRAEGIGTELATRGAESGYLDTTFKQHVENAVLSISDDFVKENADAHYNAGLEPKIIRIATGRCCDWCAALEGTYSYEDVRETGNDVFKRHNNCRCIVEYDPGLGTNARQNVHTKKWRNDQDAATLERRKTAGLRQ